MLGFEAKVRWLEKEELIIKKASNTLGISKMVSWKVMEKSRLKTKGMMDTLKKTIFPEKGNSVIYNLEF